MASVAYAILLIAIALGTFVRIHNITTRTLFSDEAFSILRITGHTEAPVRALIDDRAHPVAFAAAFQKSDANTSPAATLRSIGTEEPQRGPLYYTLANLWLPVGGTSIAGFRSLAVIIGIFAIGAAYMFGAIAFRDRFGGTILAALVALSPFHLAYARQAREYGLFTLIVFLSGAMLLRAVRRQSRASWVFFAVSCAVGLLSTPLYALVIASYAAYVAFSFLKKSIDRQRLIAFAVSVVVASVIVSPWYVYVSRVSGKVAGETMWGATVYPLPYYLTKIAFAIGAVFYDAEFANINYALGLIFIASAAGFLLMRTARSNPDAIAFAVTLAMPTALVLVVNDIRIGAHFGTIARYATPVWIALEIAVAAGAVAGLRMLGRSQTSTAIATAVLLLGGAACALADGSHETWWDNNDNVPLQAVAAAANAQPHAIILASQLPLTLALEHYLNSSVRIQVYSEHAIPTLSPSGDPNMLFAPFRNVRQAFASHEELRPALATADSSVVGTFRTRLADHVSGADGAFDVNSRENALWILPSSVKTPQEHLGKKSPK